MQHELNGTATCWFHDIPHLTFNPPDNHRERKILPSGPPSLRTQRDCQDDAVWGQSGSGPG